MCETTTTNLQSIIINNKKPVEELEAKQKRMEFNIQSFFEHYRAIEAKLLNYEIQERGKIIIHNGEKVKVLLDEDNNGDVIAYRKINTTAHSE
jgi:hypothetical protein